MFLPKLKWETKRNETGEQHNKTKQNTNEMQTNAPPNSIVKSETFIAFDYLNEHTIFAWTLDFVRSSEIRQYKAAEFKWIKNDDKL